MFHIIAAILEHKNYSSHCVSTLRAVATITVEPFHQIYSNLSDHSGCGWDLDLYAAWPATLFGLDIVLTSAIEFIQICGTVLPPVL